jgi:hypothetical protein
LTPEYSLPWNVSAVVSRIAMSWSLSAKEFSTIQ